MTNLLLSQYSSHTYNNWIFSKWQTICTELHQKLGMTTCKPILPPKPIKLCTHTSSNEQFQYHTLFCQLVGSLQYLSLALILPSSSIIYVNHDRFSEKKYFQLLKRLLIYIKDMTHLVLPIKRGYLILHSYSNTDLILHPSDLTIGHHTFVNSTLLFGSVKK